MPDEKNIATYQIERKTGNGFVKIGTAGPRNTGTTVVHYFIDTYPNSINQYRIKRVNVNGRSDYSNVITLKGGSSSVAIYPNPAKNTLNISIAGNEAADYTIEMLNASGQLVFAKDLKNVKQTSVTYQRAKESNGIYFLRTTNKNTGQIEVQKIILE